MAAAASTQGTARGTIHGKFTGYNAEQLAQEFDLTVRWVQEICKDAPPAGQLSLLDFE